MISVEVYKNGDYKSGKLVDKGIFVAGKHYTEEFPDQSVTLKNNKGEEKEYSVEKDNISFIEWSMIEDKETGFMKPVIDYDSTTHIDYAEIRRNEYWSEKVECPTCHVEVERNDLRWVNDRYGVPYKKCCKCCYYDIEREILQWEFSSDTGEKLEEDY